MEQLIELLTQIQDLAGSAIDALQGALSESGGDMPAEGEGAPPEGGGEGGPPPAEEPPA